MKRVTRAPLPVQCKRIQFFFHHPETTILLVTLLSRPSRFSPRPSPPHFVKMLSQWGEGNATYILVCNAFTSVQIGSFSPAFGNPVVFCWQPSATSHPKRMPPSKRTCFSAWRCHLSPCALRLTHPMNKCFESMLSRCSGRRKCFKQAK